MNKKAFLGLLFIIVVGILYTQFVQGKKSPQISSQKLTKWNVYNFYQPVKTKHINLGTWNPNVFYDPVKTSHFLTSDPKHGQTFKTFPKIITLTFDAPLQKGSYFKAEIWDENYIEGGNPGVSFSDDRKTMTGKLGDNAMIGMYEVMYTVCFVNEECKNGSYRFLVDPVKR